MIEKTFANMLPIIDRLDSLKDTMTDEEFERELYKEPAFRSSARPGHVTKDKYNRLSSLAKIPAARKHADRMPRGWSAQREIRSVLILLTDSKDLNVISDKLEDLILRGIINPTTTRESLDDIRRSMKQVRPRHVRHYHTERPS